ncbi:hypothetical protein WJX72_006453 [[Myrmecia] bisecta]|uniref:Flavin reductase like domain-containing protein n=1 Tax=[Myrmecia] bisecta TaxID=41462 RepID=A0AAW1QR49_9CHLO
MPHAQLIGAAAAGALSATALLVSILRASPNFARRLAKKQVITTPHPHPKYKPGDKQPHPFGHDRMISLDPAVIGGAAMYPFVISSVVPRPVAFISSLSKEGEGNLSPYSYFNAVSHDPPFLAVGHCHTKGRPEGKKDSLLNILETGEFVVCIMSEWFIEAANHTCGNYDRGINEMELSGLTPVPSVKVKPPRVKESAVHFECKLRHTYDVKNDKGEVTATVVLGEVVLAHVHEGVAAKSPSGKTIVDITKYWPVARLGGNTYSRLTEIFDLPRPDREWQFKTPTKGDMPKAGS